MHNMSDTLDVDPLEGPVGGDEVAVVEPGEEGEVHICNMS